MTEPAMAIAPDEVMKAVEAVFAYTLQVARLHLGAEGELATPADGAQMALSSAFQLLTGCASERAAIEPLDIIRAYAGALGASVPDDDEENIFNIIEEFANTFMLASRTISAALRAGLVD